MKKVRAKAQSTLKRTKQTLTEEEIAVVYTKLRRLSNAARYDEAYELSSKLKNKYPDVLEFAYYEAVMTAEEHTGYTAAEIRRRYRLAAHKLQPLLKRLRGTPLKFRAGVRNEYYWFSRQPLKQYKLGKEMVRKGLERSYYSQGVGAEELAKKYGLKGNRALCLRWAKRSEQAWLKFFKVDSNWSNSYLFYAAALGYQGRMQEMENALLKSARIAGKSPRWEALEIFRREVAAVHKVLNKSKVRGG